MGLIGQIYYICSGRTYSHICKLDQFSTYFVSNHSSDQFRWKFSKSSVFEGNFGHIPCMGLFSGDFSRLLEQFPLFPNATGWSALDLLVVLAGIENVIFFDFIDFERSFGCIRNRRRLITRRTRSCPTRTATGSLANISYAIGVANIGVSDRKKCVVKGHGLSLC